MRYKNINMFDRYYDSLALFDLKFWTTNFELLFFY